MSDIIQAGITSERALLQGTPRLFLSPEVEGALAAALHKFETVVSGFLGTALPATPQRAWEKFAQLPSPAQLAIIQGINAQADFAMAAMEDGIEAVDERAMLVWVNGRLGLLADNGVVSDVAAGDVVEIFNSDHIQVYRSYSCFALCNYSLLELASYPWFELYERSSSIVNKFLDDMKSVFEGKSSYISYSELPEYTLREIMTDESAIFGIKEKFVSKMRSAITGQSYILSVKTIREFPTTAGDSTVRFL